MIHLMFQKLIHKKWMMLSLMLGNILLVAIATSYPMFRDASLTRMLSDEFENYIEENNTNPSIIAITGKMRKRYEVTGYEWAKQKSQTVLDELGLNGGLALKQSELLTTSAVTSLERQDAKEEGQYIVGALSDLADNCEVISGQMYSDEINDGVIEAVVTVSGFVDMDVLIGEEFEFRFLRFPDGNPVKIRITGVINSNDNADYWIYSESRYSDRFLISDKIFEDVFLSNPESYEFNTTWYMEFDHSDIEYSNVAAIINGTYSLIDSVPNASVAVETPRYLNFLSDYLVNEKKIEATLLILQIPVLVLLCAFIYMISGQMYNMEQNEIALMQSRGAGKGQIFLLYLMQAVFVALIGAVAGLPLGSLLCRALGSASAFLEFNARRSLSVRYSQDVFLYAGAAVLVSILMSVLPSVLLSRKSIVKTKASKARTKHPMWQKLFLDVVLLAVSLYGYYNFSRQKEQLELQVLEGQALDPLLYLSSSLFILGAALLMLRIIPLIVRLIYVIGKKRWSPALYSSFKEILQSGSSRYFIMTFLILTVALGIFNTTVARTIASNNESNLSYLTGADITLEEGWKSNISTVMIDPTVPLTYQEPDFTKYERIEGVAETAKVYINTKATVGKETVRVMGINTKEFGEVTSLPSGLLKMHYYNYLNEMSVDSDYILVSSSFRDVQGYKVGDRIGYTVDGELIYGVIADFVDYFPGFDTQKTSYNADGTAYNEDNYLIVAHLSTIQKKLGVTPYYVWIKMADGAGTDSVYEFIEENGIELAAFNDLSEEIEDIKSDTLFQGTNGILTLSFMVILVLCFIGYLIYWTLAMSSRELLLGVLRAMGMSKGEIFVMLINEQIYSSILPLASGAGIGILASKLFVPLIQIAYSASNQAVPLKLVTENSDMVRLTVIIAAMLVICLVILARQIFRMKIAQALKLGED